MNSLIFLFYLIWTIVALLIAISPRNFWKLTQSWKATSEPSKLYFILNRVFAIIFTIIGVLLLLKTV